MRKDMVLDMQSLMLSSNTCGEGYTRNLPSVMNNPAIEDTIQYCLVDRQ